MANGVAPPDDPHSNGPEERWLRAPVRPLVTIMVSATFCYLAITDKVPIADFLIIAGVVITFWFTSRPKG